jgi:hypothetical protein
LSGGEREIFISYLLFSFFATIQLPKPNNSALYNEQLQHTALIYQISLSSQQIHQPRPYALIFGG